MSGNCRGADYKSVLHAIKESGCYRYLREINGPQGPTVKIGDQELINFCSNDYLGLANDKRLVAAMHRAVDKYGVGSGASPLICGRSDAHLELETLIASLTGRDRALVFSSGYAANLAVISTLGLGRKGSVFEDRLNHASLIDGAILGRSHLVSYKHCNVSSLTRELVKYGGHKFVLTDTVFSMDGDIAPLNDLAAVCEKYHALMAADDAHGFGVLGEDGKGALSLFNLAQAEVPVLIITFGKAVGVTGACVAGPTEIIEMLIQKARPYIYSTAMPSALAATITESLKIIFHDNSSRAHLKNLINIFRRGAKALSLPCQDSATPIQPLLIGSNERAVNFSQKLTQHGILVAAIRPPTVPLNSSRLRITLTAAHTEAQVYKLLGALEECFDMDVIT